MKQQNIQLRTMPPIVCREDQRDQVRAAIATQQRAGILPEEVDVRWTVMRNGIVSAQVILPPVPRPNRRREDSVAASMGKALAFVGGLAGLGVTFAALAWLTLTHLGINWPAVLGGATLVALALMVAVNRTNHAGACPGIVIHCRGCKH